VGIDKAGIVASVARVLAEREMSIRDLRGHVSPAPQSGTPIYTLSVLVDARGTTAAELEQFFEPVSARLKVEITASAEPSPDAI
jgi:glycine cleavage system regulatory protein